MTADVMSPEVSIHYPKCYQRQDLSSLNLVDDPIWVFDLVRKCMWYANDAAVQLWSAKSLADLLARDFRKDMSEASETRLDDYLLKFSSDDSFMITDQWTFYPNGLGPKTVNTRAKGIAVEEGRIAMLVHGTIQETTSKQNQEALRAVEMLRHLPVAVCLADLDGNTVSQNPEALSVFGDEKKNLESQSENTDDPAAEEEEKPQENKESVKDNSSSNSAFVKRFVDRDLGRRVLENVRTGEKVHRLEALQHTVHGPKWSAIQVKKTKDPVTSQPILLYSARDISAVVEAERKAAAADTAKMDLLADMKHAVRCSLQSVVGVVELISRNNPNDNSKRCVYEEEKEGDCGFDSSLRPSAQLLLTVLNDLMLSIRRVTNEQPDNNSPANLDTNNQHNNQSQHGSLSGTSINSAPHSHINLEHRPIDVMHIVENEIAKITPNAKSKDLSVTTRITSQLRNVSVMGDGNRLRQLLFEILHNAVKHTSRGGIIISVKRMMSKKQSRRLRLRFEVQDTGVGLNLEQQRIILQSDNQLEHRRGLKISQSLVKAMGGEIGVHSKPGFGATFWFEIPFLCLAGMSNQSIGSGNKGNRNNRGKSTTLAPVLDEHSDDHDGGLQVLLVDSDNVGRKVMAALLQQSGHTVAAAGTGKDMVRLVKSPSQTSFDVILVETQSDGGGFDYTETLLESIREIRRLGFSKEALPILALTASVPLASYPELGLNDWLTKPISIKDIQKAMTNAICNNVESRTGSAFTDDSFSLDNLSNSRRGSLVNLNTTMHSDDTPPSISRRGSLVYLSASMHTDDTPPSIPRRRFLDVTKNTPPSIPRRRSLEVATNTPPSIPRRRSLEVLVPAANNITTSTTAA